MTSEKRAKFSQIQSSTAAGAGRQDIGTWFDLLDMDDHASFGGKI